MTHENDATHQPQQTIDQQRRYSRQIMLAEIGESGQQRLLNARVLVIGAGGLGSALISYLAAAGVGTIGIIDDDRVELSNLARQIIHETGDIGRLKVESAADRIAELNPDVNIVTYPFALTAGNAAELMSDSAGYNIVADGCDNFTTRFIVNKACIARTIPLVSAAIAGWTGQIMTIAPHLRKASGCYQCLVNPDAPETNSCRESGVIGPLAGIIGSMQALEVVNLILRKSALLGKVAIYDALRMSQRVSNLRRDTDCRACAALPAHTDGAKDSA